MTLDTDLTVPFGYRLSGAATSEDREKVQIILGLHPCHTALITRSEDYALAAGFCTEVLSASEATLTEVAEQMFIDTNRPVLIVGTFVPVLSALYWGREDKLC